MDEIAKTEARNYLSAAGFFVIAAFYLLDMLNTVGGIPRTVEPQIITGVGLLLIALLLIILRKRDMIAIFFMMLSFCYIAIGFSFAHVGVLVLLCFYGLVLLTLLVTLTGKDKVKWLLIIIPIVMIARSLVDHITGQTILVTFILSALIALYFALACASEKLNLPGRQLLIADEETDFKASGSLLGYLLFATTCGIYVMYYIAGETLASLEAVHTINLVAGFLLIFVGILLLTVGKMRFTPIMFILIGITELLAMFSSGAMFIGIGILSIIIGLFAMLRKESRILPGIMLIVYGCADFFTVYAGGNTPLISVILNAIPCLIAIYLAFVVYSQKKLPKF